MVYYVRKHFTCIMLVYLPHDEAGTISLASPSCRRGTEPWSGSFARSHSKATVAKLGFNLLPNLKTYALSRSLNLGNEFL